MTEIISEAEMAAVPAEILEEAVSRQGQNSPPLDDRAHITSKIEGLDPEWVSTIKKKHRIKPKRLKASSADKSCSIHRVPCVLRQHNKKVYEPQLVSIGPFHYKKRRHQLRAMEEHKWRYLDGILSRNGESSLEQYLVAVKELEEEARNCYSEEINLDSNSFVEMMVLDGCFIIELLRKRSGRGSRDDDPIFELEWLFKALKEDLFMLENQIPYFILECLSNLIDQTGDSSHSSLVKMVLTFFYDHWNNSTEDHRKLTKEDVSRHSSSFVERALHFCCRWNLTNEGRFSTIEKIKDLKIQIQHKLGLLSTERIRTMEERIRTREEEERARTKEERIRTKEERIRTVITRVKDSGIEIQHLLHLIHSSLVSSIAELKNNGKEVRNIHSASKLKEVGIKFRKNDDKDAANFLDIKFQNGVIKIPPIIVEDGTNLQFLNLIALEQCYRHSKSYITTYFSFMDCLINNVKDVEILCKYGIIENWLGSEEDVATLFNDMGKEVLVYDEDFYLSVVCDEIIEYSEKTWHKARATLMHDYFKSPWAIISFVGAVFLLVFTMIQTFFTSFPKFAYGH